MATISKMRDGLQIRLATISGLRSGDIWPEPLLTPAAVVMPESDEQVSFGATHATLFSILVIVDKASLRVGQDTLDAYMSHSGANSIQAAIEGDRTLAGAVHDVDFQGWAEYGQIEVDEVPYLAAKATVEVLHNA